MKNLTQVDFYVTQYAALTELNLLIAKISAKAFNQQERVFILCQNRSHAEELDNALWAYQDISFLPHSLIDATPTNLSVNPILLSYEEKSPQENGILINLSLTIPSWYQQFKRIIETVYENNKTLARQHYTFYKDAGFSVKSHTI